MHTLLVICTTCQQRTLATAVGVYYQVDQLQDTPGYHTLNGNLWGSSSSGITAGDSNTKAVYAELQIPLLRDSSNDESLDLTASGRWTDVNTYGSGTTYKVSAIVGRSSWIPCSCISWYFIPCSCIV